MKNWLEKNKIILIVFLAISFVFITLFYIQVSYIIKPENFQELERYIETGEITKTLFNYLVLTFINLITFIVWTITFIIVLWKVIFPTNKSVKEAFMYEQFKFLYQLPSKIRKGMKNYE